MEYGCLNVYKILQDIYKDAFDYEQMKKTYLEIFRCGSQNKELTDYNSDIEKDLLRTFPKVP